MKRSLFVVLAVGAGCATHPVVARPVSTEAAAPTAAGLMPSPECLGARTVRAEAEALDRGGHETLALAKLDEANAACAAERASSAVLEAKLLAEAGKCAAVRALPSDAQGAKEARATCDAREAASTGTAETMRAKMREADTAERAKDWARAKTLYIAAWGELHPNPRAIESAARMAALAGDAAESRRLRDRALVEAEAAEHAVAELTDRVRVVHGSPRLDGTTLWLADRGNVVARDTSTGELRVLVAGHGSHTTLSPRGTIAVSESESAWNTPTTLAVWDVLTGDLLFRVSGVARYAVSPDDTRLLVHDFHASDVATQTARVFDVASGKVVAKFSGDWSSNVYGHVLFFAPGAEHAYFYAEGNDAGFRQWSSAKNAFTAVRLPSAQGVAAPSIDGRFVAFLERTEDGAPIHVRDMTTDKDVAQVTGHFHSVETLAVSPDGKTLATGSRNSLRLWDVASKKQLSKEDTEDQGGVTDSRDPTEFAFSSDGKTMVLAGRGLATAWDVATGAKKPLVSDQPPKKVLRVAPAPDGVAIVLEDEVRIVPRAGEPTTVCRGMTPLYHDIIGPTNVAFSSSGKSFACAMSDGWVHVFDTSTWKERAVVKRGPAAPAARPVDLVFSSDDKALTVVSDGGRTTYDAATGTLVERSPFKHAGVGLAPRHARFDDGGFAVRTWSGALALFDASGAFAHDVKLPFAASIDSLDAFSADGSTYAVAVGKTLHLVDLRDR